MYRSMFPLKLITLSSLVTITTALFSSDGSKGLLYERFTVNTSNNGLDHHHRSLVTDAENKLQYNWWNWNLCTNAYPSESFTPMNTFVPNNTVFLAGYPTYNIINSSDACKSNTITRTGTISVGQQTVFFPLINVHIPDADDDWKSGRCSQFPNQSDAARFAFADQYDFLYTNATYMKSLYFDIDGKNATPVYLYDENKYFFNACDDANKTDEEYYKTLFPGDMGDLCDIEPYQPIGGLDVAPMLGWFGIDVRVWADGESHTYEFGSLTECVTARYVLTAKAVETEEKTCGLFGLGFFCPLKWFGWFLGLFT